MFFEAPSVQETRTTLSNACLDQQTLDAYAATRAELDFDGCRFTGVRFDGMTLRNWNFFGCDLDAVSFAGACLENVRWLGCSARSASFHGAHLQHVRISESELAFTDWDASEVDDAVFDAVDLREAWFDGARLAHVAIFDCRLEGVDLEKASLAHTRMEDFREQPAGTHAVEGCLSAASSSSVADCLAGEAVLHGQEAN